MNIVAHYTRSDHPLAIQNVRQNIVGIDVQVPLLDGSYQTYINFDNAASTPALHPVVSWCSSVHRGLNKLARRLPLTAGDVM